LGYTQPLVVFVSLLLQLHGFNAVTSWFQIAAEVAAPLAKTDEIVLLGDDRATSEVSRLLASMPPSVQALTGVDISKV
jgi:hypothetical protein